MLRLPVGGRVGWGVEEGVFGGGSQTIAGVLFGAQLSFLGTAKAEAVLCSWTGLPQVCREGSGRSRQQGVLNNVELAMPGATLVTAASPS
jgi:hypothetical protein